MRTGVRYPAAPPMQVPIPWDRLLHWCYDEIMKAAVSIQSVSITLEGKTPAIKDVSLELAKGRITGIIGPSGAGKTTLVRAIVGRQAVSSGVITIDQLPAGSASLRAEVSYMPQGVSIYADLTVEENLEYFCAMQGYKKSDRVTVVRRLLESIDMEDKAKAIVGNLSGGQRQRASLAVALIGEPKLLVLDEPTVGLDPVLRDRLWRLFRQLAERGVTLIVTSHSMDEAERCDDLVLLRDGRVVASSTPVELLQRTSSTTIEESFLKLVGDTKE